uniref:Glycosyltransferase n=1 Tax=Thermus islandicus TaxID=540988 RepID=A0A7C2C317_9DEIN
MELPKDAVLVDTRPRPAYEAGHLPGARHLDLSAPRLRLREEGELKALEAGLTELFQSLGLRSPVVLYDEGLTSRLCRTAFFLGLGGLEVEGWGNVFIEAAACGRPVVVGDSGGARESLVPGETGLLVDGRRVPEVAEAVASLLADPETAERMGRAGRARVERAFTWERAAAELAAYLRRAT